MHGKSLDFRMLELMRVTVHVIHSKDFCRMLHDSKSHFMICWSIGLPIPFVRPSQLTWKAFFFNFFTLLNMKEYSGRWRPLIQRSFWKFQSVCLSDLLWRCQNMRLGSNDLVIVIAGSIFEVSRWAQLLKKFLCLKILHFAEWTILEFYMFLSV